MQILGKRSKVLLIVIAIIMLVAVGVSFAMWDSMSVVKATTGYVSYSSAQVGDVITFGEYYQDINLKDETTGEYKKTPIEWIVVDKDERTGQLTLMSKYILAAGSYFGNYYDDGNGYGFNYNNNTADEIDGVPYNQAYVDSTARAYLNNLERLDMGGDTFSAETGYIPSGINSRKDSTVNGAFSKGTGLLSSVGFSNQRYWTKLTSASGGNISMLIKDPKSGLTERSDNLEVFYQRPIANEEYKARPVTRGFFDEAFTDEQKSLIIPKVIAGYTGNRWPAVAQDIATKSYIEGSLDKVWLPSATELNIMNGQDWNQLKDNVWTTPSDESGSTVFEYFKNYSNYTNPITNTKNTSVTDAVKSIRTSIAENGMVGNYSIPIYDKGTTTPKTAISIEANKNSSNDYWTRTPFSYWCNYVCKVSSSGRFAYNTTRISEIGVRPCIILKY